MINCRLIPLTKNQIPSKYKLVEENVYLDLNDGDGFFMYRIGISVDHTGKKVSIQELEQLVEPHFLYIEKELRLHIDSIQYYILGGELEDIQKFKSMIK